MLINLLVVFFSLIIFILYLKLKKAQKKYKTLKNNLIKKNEKNNENKNLKKQINLLKEDLKKYKLITNNIFETAFIINNKEDIIFCNKNAEKMFEYPKIELKGKNIKDLIYPKDIEIFNRYNDSKYSLPYDIYGMKKNKSIIGMKLLRIRKLYENNKGIHYDLVIIRNITKYKEIKNKLEEENDKLNNILNNINIGVILINENYKIKSLNSAAQKIVGKTSSLNKKINNLFMLIDHYNNKVIKIKIPDYNNNSGIYIQNKSLILKNKNSETIKILYNISPILNNNSTKAKGAVIVLQDITYREKIERELAKQDNLNSIGILAGGIAHDFNNFLTSIIGNITIAKDISNNKEVCKLLKEAQLALDRATKLTRELMVFSKGNNPIFEVIDNLDQLIYDYISFALRGSNIKIKYLQNKNKIWNSKIDKNQIAQVIHNITINAKQSMPYGGEIQYKIENINLLNDILFLNNKISSGKYIKISIKDTGSGIKKEIIKNIFDPYFTTKKAGTGLGLSISYSIIKKHNGKIIFKSEENKGTEVTIFLNATNEKVIKRKINNDNKIISKNLKILLMDDDEMILKVLSKIINKLKYKVIITKNGEEALSVYKKEKILNKKVDIVITDLTIPNGMGGEILAQKILEFDKNAKLIVSSGYYNSPIISNYKDYGFKATLEKPYKIKEVKNAISEALL